MVIGLFRFLTSSLNENDGIPVVITLFAMPFIKNERVRHPSNNYVLFEEELQSLNHAHLSRD